MTIAAMVRDTQENGSNSVEGDTEDGSSLTNRQQVGSNDTQGTIGVSLIPGSSVVGVSLVPGSPTIGVSLVPGSSTVGVSLLPG
jgi:hypothetical protein